MKNFYNSYLLICFQLLSATEPHGPSVITGVYKSWQGMNSSHLSHVPSSCRINTLSHEAGDVGLNQFRENMNL